MTSNRRIRAPRRWACAVVVVISALAGCGSQGGAEPDAAGGTVGTTQAPSPGDNTADEQVAPSPGKNMTDQPVAPTMPPTRKPVLHVKGTYNYKVQILDAKTMADLPNDPPPAGTTALALLLRVEAEPRNRSIHAPYAELGINYPSRRSDLSQYVGTVLDDATPFMTEDQMLFGGEGSQGIDPVFGTLQANTVYYHWVWQIVSEKANLKGATLCETHPDNDNCIPVGEIKTTP